MDNGDRYGKNAGTDMERTTSFQQDPSWNQSGWQHKKNQDKKKHHHLVNHLCQNGKDESKLS
jgi:hypothetical protein